MCIRDRFIVVTHYENDLIHDEVLSYIESKGFSPKITAGIKHERIDVLKSGSMEVRTSNFESERAYVQLQNLLPAKRFRFVFMLKNNTYNYSPKDSVFLNGYCNLIKAYVKKNTSLEFIDYKPNKDTQICHSLLENGYAIYKNVNNPKPDKGFE